MKCHLMVRKTQEALKKRYHHRIWTKFLGLTPGWYLSESGASVRARRRPPSSSNRVTFPFPPRSLPPRPKTESLEVHTFGHLFGTIVPFIGWVGAGVTSVRGAVSYLWAAVTCLWEKVHLLLVTPAWNRSVRQEHVRLKRVRYECRVGHTAGKCPRCCNYLCVCVCDTGYLGEYMQEQGRVSQVCPYLPCPRESSDDAAARGLTSWPELAVRRCRWRFETHCPAFKFSN